MNNCMCGICDFCCGDCERDGDWEDCPENAKLLNEWEEEEHYGEKYLYDRQRDRSPDKRG